MVQVIINCFFLVNLRVNLLFFAFPFTFTSITSTWKKNVRSFFFLVYLNSSYGNTWRLLSTVSVAYATLLTTHVAVANCMIVCVLCERRELSGVCAGWGGGGVGRPGPGVRPLHVVPARGRSATLYTRCEEPPGLRICERWVGRGGPLARPPRS